MFTNQIRRFLSPALDDCLYGSPALEFVDFRVVEQADGIFAFYVVQISFHVAEADALQSAAHGILQNSLQHIAVPVRTVFKYPPSLA